MTAASDLLATSSVDQVTMTAIAQRAGLSKAAIYRYFPNKRSLLHALVQRLFDETEELIATLTSSNAAPHAVLEEGFRIYLEQHRQEPFRVQLWAAIRSDPELSRLVLEDSRKNAANIAQYLLATGAVDDQQATAERLVLVIALTDAVIRLLVSLDADEASRAINGFCDLACSYVLQ